MPNKKLSQMSKLQTNLKNNFLKNLFLCSGKKQHMVGACVTFSIAGNGKHIPSVLPEA